MAILFLEVINENILKEKKREKGDYWNEPATIC